MGAAVVDAVRATGARQPISLGDGAWGIEVSGHDNGYSLRDLAPIVDFVGPHVYPMQDDQARQLLTASFVCELAASLGQPVVLEEFGVSSDFASDENAAHYYRQVLYTTLLAGARGWIAWNNCDFDDLRDEDPYRHHVFELHFGLTDRHGNPKEQLRTLAAFAGEVGEIAEGGWEPVKGDVAIVVPEHFERELPFTEPEYRQDIRDNLLQSYIAARESDLPVELQRERDGIADSRPAVHRPVREAPHRTRTRPPARVGGRRRHRLPLLLRRKHDEPAWPVDHLARRDLRRDPSPALWPRRPDRGRGGGLPVRRGLRRHRRRNAAHLPGRWRAECPLVPPRRSRGRRDRRHRRPRAPGTPSPRTRARLRGAVHVSARAHGRETPEREPGEHVAASTPRSRRPQTSGAPFGSTIHACSWACSARARPRLRCSSNCSADAVGAEPIFDGWTALEPTDEPINLDPFGVALVRGATRIADRAADAERIGAPGEHSRKG